MDRTTLEKYLRIFPEISNEIIRLESEISDLESAKLKFNNYPPDEYTNSVLESIDAALESSKYDLKEIFNAKTKISRSLSTLTIKQRKIIELRFWNNQFSPRTWKEIAGALKYNHVYVQRLYKNALENILYS